LAFWYDVLGENMNIENLFKYLGNNKEFIVYLFKHRDRVIYINEIEDYCRDTTLEILENFEIIELSEDRVVLDGRVVNFLDEYIEGSESIEITTISEKIDALKHKIEILSGHKTKQKELLPKVRRDIKKIDFILFSNLDKLRIHIDRVYKSVDDFALKLKELNYYKDKLRAYESALNGFEEFLRHNLAVLKSFYNIELNVLLDVVYENRITLNRNLIPLTQDVIEYINQAQEKNIFIEKVIKLKELKDSLELKKHSNLEELISGFDLLSENIKVSTRLNDEVLEYENIETILQKVSDKSRLKTRVTSDIVFNNPTKEKEFLNVMELNLQFKSSKFSLIEFLLNNNRLKSSDIDKISEVYCKMVLLYEDEYSISEEQFFYKNISFAKVYYEDNIG